MKDKMKTDLKKIIPALKSLFDRQAGLEKKLQTARGVISGYQGRIAEAESKIRDLQSKQREILESGGDGQALNGQIRKQQTAFEDDSRALDMFIKANKPELIESEILKVKTEIANQFLDKSYLDGYKRAYEEQVRTHFEAIFDLMRDWPEAVTDTAKDNGIAAEFFDDFLTKTELSLRPAFRREATLVGGRDNLVNTVSKYWADAIFTCNHETRYSPEKVDLQGVK
jgi:hypothetical protein